MAPEIEHKESYRSRSNSSSFNHNGCWPLKMAEWPLSIATNNSFKYNIFPSNAKVACIKPLEKKTEDKHCISTFRPVSI